MNKPDEDAKKMMQQIKDGFIEIQGSSAYRNDRDRPYDGQPHTDYGERGMQELYGITMRDIRDCFIKGFLLCCGVDQPTLYERVENNSWLPDDIYKVDFSHIDPIAAAQNMGCEIEKMMGIFPNIPKFEEENE